MRNRYQSKCNTCGKQVAMFCGTLTKLNGKWQVNHIDCDQVAVNVITFSSGHTIERNINGTCIDAPCCGCCTF